jgi:hypothetical protein
VTHSLDNRIADNKASQKVKVKKGVVILTRIIKNKGMCTQAKENNTTAGKRATNTISASWCNRQISY